MATFDRKFPGSDRSFNYGLQEFNFPVRTDSNSSDVEFEFLEDSVEVTPAGSSSDENESLDGDLDGEERENGAGSVEKNKSFWESQHQLLMGTLYRSSSLESRIRNSVKEALKEIRETEGNVCACGRPAAGNCKNCLMKEVSFRLRNAGFNSALCRSKWRSSQDIPSGEHAFLDVIENSKKGEMRIIVELNFIIQDEIFLQN